MSRQRKEAPPQGSRAGRISRTGSRIRISRRCRQDVPTETLVFHAPLDEARRRTAQNHLQVARNTNLTTGHKCASGRTARWRRRHTRPRQTRSGVGRGGRFRRGRSVQLRGLGQTERRRERRRCSRACRPDGIIAAGICGWKAASRRFIVLHSWPDNAIKVIAKKEMPKGKWNHVCVTYDGSSKAGGVKIYRQRRSAGSDAGQRLAHAKHPHSTVPFKIGQRDTEFAGDGRRTAGFADIRAGIE